MIAINNSQTKKMASTHTKRRKTIALISLMIAFSAILFSSDVMRKDSPPAAILETYPDLPILHLSGTPYENGFEHGRIMKSRIIELVGLWKKEIEKNYQVSADEFISTFLDSTDYIPAIKKWTPDLWDEIRGISAGCGIDLQTIFAFQLVDEIWTNARLLNIPHHCTSVGINNYKKDGGINYLAQNIDITPFYHGYEIVLDINDKRSDCRKLVTTFAGFIGVNGLNEEIGITVNSLSDLKSSFEGLPVACIVRGVLDKKSFAAAEDFLRNIQHASGQNYLIGSEQEIISLECAADLVTEYWPDSSKNYTFHANRPLSNTSYHIKQATDLYTFLEDERFELMQTKITTSEAINEKTLDDILSTKPICNSQTFASTIMQFHSDYNQLSISPGRPDSTEYRVLRIKK